MVGIAQLVRVPGCGPGGRGFEPHYSPHFTDSAYYGVSPSGKAPDFDSGTRRFKSCHPSHFFRDPLAQLVEHLTFNQVVRSSTLRRITNPFFYCRCFPVCGCGGIGRRARFRFWCPKGVWVQVPSPAPKRRDRFCGSSSFGRAQPCQG